MLALSGGTKTESPGHLLSLAHEAGANAVMSKPFSPERLLKTVAKLLKESGSAGEESEPEAISPGLRSAGEATG